MRMKDDRYLLFEVGGTYINAAIYKKGKVSYLDRIYTNFIYYAKEEYGISNRQLDELIDILRMTILKNEIDVFRVRVYAFSFFRKFSKRQLYELRNQVYVKLNLNFYIVEEDLEKFYLQNTKNGESLLQGIVKQEFRRVVICGSFRKHMEDVKKVALYCKQKNIEVLSPKNLDVIAVFDGSFVLFHGEKIENERESYWIENKHTNSIENADAVLICNSNGYFGNTTIYEIGYAMACNKMVVLMDCGETEFDMNFPRNYGLL